MEKGKNWKSSIPEQLEAFQKLGDREKNAVRVSLDGIRMFRGTGEKPVPIRVKITQENPFNLRAFTSVLYDMGIDIVESLEKAGRDAIKFQPKLRDEESGLILEGVIVIPDGLRKYFS